MDWIGFSDRTRAAVKRCRYALLAVALGILLLTLPQNKTAAPVPEPSTVEMVREPLEEGLTRILSRIEGAGKVEVLLTPARGEETLYQTDEDTSSAERRTDTVLVTGEDRLETGLVRQVNPPVYRGAVIVCQGAGDARVRLSVVEAVMSVTGLTSDRITVLKMK